MVAWVKDTAAENNMTAKITSSSKALGLFITRGRKGRVELGCDRSGTVRDKAPLAEGKIRRNNTSSKLTKCPFHLVGRKIAAENWKLETKNGNYNYELQEVRNWHSSYSRLKEAEKKKIAEMSSINIRPKHILAQLQADDPQNVSHIRQVYNETAKGRREARGDMTNVQYFFQLLRDHEYFYAHTVDADSN
ncbi:hypothetical protein JJ728_23175, partial [Salmonella enterica subsp. enterica serovar Typhi]|uniref:hypothetical protein n=1 Tax=Salmonella enterica TaxID=28901 RepID=UPI0019159531